jgi:WD40 repeat protein
LRAAPIILAIVAGCHLFGVAQASAQRRLALVVGIDRYQNLPPDQQLRTAVNDARSVGGVLTRIGFAVTVSENPTRPSLIDRFDEFTRQLSPGDEAAFFFAGHGVAIGGGNYILPADVPNVESGQETRLARAALGEIDIVSDLQSRGVRVALVILDACRNNPFKRPGLRGVGNERGLTRIEPVRGVFTMYSAGIGQTALDRLGDNDANPNSVFTRALLPRLGQPGLALGDLAVDVREDVTRLALAVGHDQRPAYYDETTGGKFYLAGLPSGPTPPQALAPNPPVQSAPVIVRPNTAAATAGPGKDAAVSPRDQILGSHDEVVNAVAFSPDNKMLVSTGPDATLRLWNVETGKLARKIDDYTGYNGITLAYNDDGSRILEGTSNGALNIWEPDNKRLGSGLAIGGPIASGPATSVAFSADGRIAAFAGSNREIQIFRTTYMSQRNKVFASFRGHTGVITSMAFLDDGQRLVSASADKSIRLWESGKPARFFKGHSSPATSIAASLNGQLIASGSDGGAILIWDVESGNLLQTLRGSVGTVASLAFSGDGRQLISGGADKTLRLWDVVAGTALKTFEGHKEAVTAVAFSRDGHAVASGSKDRSIRLWAIDPPTSVASPKP